MPSTATRKSVFITSPTFAKVVKTPLENLLRQGYDVSRNETGRSLTPEEILSRAKEADAVIASTESFHDTIGRFPRLRLISRTGIGLDSVPLKRCKELGVRVHYTPDAVTDAVAEMAVGAMIAMARGLVQTDRLIREGKWIRHVGPGIGGRTVGIVGFGRIGKSLANLLTVFKPGEILLNDVRNLAGETRDFTRSTGFQPQTADLESLLERSDYVSLHVPANPTTKNMIDAGKLALMKREAFLVNYARGGVVNETDLSRALEEGALAGAALDVFSEEPYRGALRSRPETLLSAHMGSCSVEGRLKMDTQAADAVIRFFEGLPLANEVDCGAEAP